MKQTNVEMAFSGKKVTEIVGISYRQLDYWTRTELISPSIEKEKEVEVVVDIPTKIFSSSG